MQERSDTNGGYVYSVPKKLESMKFECKYSIGDMVVLKTDKERKARMITRITFNPELVPTYNLAYEGSDSWHYEMEFNQTETKASGAGFKFDSKK